MVLFLRICFVVLIKEKFCIMRPININGMRCPPPNPLLISAVLLTLKHQQKKKKKI